MKQSVIKSMVDSGVLVRLYVNTRRPSLNLPPVLLREEWVCLDIGLPSALVRPIYDLAISEWGVHGTLSFGGWPFYCEVPYDAILAARDMVSGGIVSWQSGATAEVRRDTAPSTERLPPKEPVKVVDFAAWRRAHGR